MLLRSGRRLATQEEAPRRRGCKASLDLLAWIPEEILLDILVRLPARSVLRCRAVCRLWRRLASGPAFLLDHHRRQPELQLISSYRTADSSNHLPRLEALRLRGGAGEFRPVFRFPELFRSVSVDASCEGLFVVNGCICNPATRQSARLSCDGNIVGLFRHQPSGEHRVLYWRPSPSELPVHVYCPDEYRIQTVGTNRSRRVDCSALGWRGLFVFGAPVFLNGSLHLHSGGVRRIVVFDTVAETFRYLRPPPVNPRHVMHLLDMAGTLTASISKDGMSGMRIFMLQDREHEVWTFQYRIELPVVDIRRFQEQGDFWAKVVSDEGDMLVSCYGQLLHCDKRGNVVANFKYDDDIPVVLPYRLKESLIQHTFFNKTDN